MFRTLMFGLVLTLSGYLAAGEVGDRLKPVAPGDYSEVPANPFGFPNVLDFHGSDVLEFARNVTLAGNAADPNAEPWADAYVSGTFGSIDGEWAGRWTSSGDPGLGWTRGTAKIRSLGSRVFILYEEVKPATEPRYDLVEMVPERQPESYSVLIEAVREGDRLVGRFSNPKDMQDTSPWAGKIVDEYRIDGQWGAGRWDFRRGRLAAGGDLPK